MSCRHECYTSLGRFCTIRKPKSPLGGAKSESIANSRNQPKTAGPNRGRDHPPGIVGKSFGFEVGGRGES